MSSSDHGRALPLADEFQHAFKDSVGHGSHQLADFFAVELGLAFHQGCAGDGLVHDGERIAHGAITGFGQQGQRLRISQDSFLERNLRQLGHDVVELDGVEAEVLAPGPDSLRDVFRLRGRHHEDDVFRRFFQGLEERVKGGIRDLMGFVEKINLVAIPGGA